MAGGCEEGGRRGPGLGGGNGGVAVDEGLHNATDGLHPQAEGRHVEEQEPWGRGGRPEIGACVRVGGEGGMGMGMRGRWGLDDGRVRVWGL